MSTASAVRPLAPSSGLLSALVLAGAVGTGVAIALQPSEGWAGLLTAGLYGVTLALGGALFLAIQVVSGARWWFPLRGVPLRLAGTLPVPLAAVGLALVLGLQSLYPWARAAVVEASPLLQAKRAWLNAPLFLARAVVLGLVWLALVGALRSTLGAAILKPSPEARRRLVRTSLVFLPVFALTLSVAAWDWGMSLEPEWFSTMYGVLLFAGTFQGGIAAVTVLALLLDRQGRLDAPLGESARHDLGKLLFAFSTFWAYVWFCQYMLIWYANLPEETGHYAARFGSGWTTLFYLNPILCFVLPFVTQISQGSKRDPATLYQVALAVLLGRWLDTYLLVAPSQGPVPALPIGALAAAVAVLSGMRLLWERERSNGPVVRVLGLVVLALLAAAARGGAEEPATSAAPQEDRFGLRFEIRSHFRHSRDEQVRVPFPFPPDFVPAGQDGVYLRTVAPGSSFEVSSLALSADAELTPVMTAHATVHVIDLYNRNPTSSDDLVALREAWVLFGRRPATLAPLAGTSVYARIGKAPRFTRPLERRFESYGLWGTAVGRFEEIGVELGGSLGRHMYWRGLIANGNPLFFRDPNALAGDNGTPERTAPNPDPKLESGFPLLYDAKAQDLHFDEHFLYGGGVGLRFVSADPDRPDGLDLLGWYFERTLADEARIRGSFYEGDLDLLRGVGIPLPFAGRDKSEWGANVSARWEGLRLFGQYVDQKIAGLGRRGFEAEAAYRIPLGGLFASGDEPVFNWIQPAVRYSTIDNRFGAPVDFVAPSVAWDWSKLDLGLRVGWVSF
jgi:hypothetical protein